TVHGLIHLYRLERKSGRYHRVQSTGGMNRRVAASASVLQPSSTSSSCAGSTALVSLNSCERIRPERPRNGIQRLVWVPGAQRPRVGFTGIPDDDGTNPRMALRRLLRLYEGRQYREAASFVTRLPGYTLRAALPELPLDLLIESLPQGLALLEALYARLLELGVRDARLLRLEQLLWRLVQLVASAVSVGDQQHLRAAARLLVALNRAAPSARNALISRQRALERAVEGLGKHGLVMPARTGASLTPLRLALREQLDARADACKLALHKIDSLHKHAGHHKGEQSVQAASHQRQLSLGQTEVQHRLSENEELLEAVEKACSSEPLSELVSELKARVDQDKEALRQWAALDKSDGASNTTTDGPSSLAAKLLHFSRGCSLALQLMSSNSKLQDSNGVRFDCYYYPEADEFGFDEEEEEEEEESSSAGYHTDESCSPTPPEPGGPHILTCLEGLPCQDTTVERLRERYSGLYSHASQHTLSALHQLQALSEAPELKAKIVYSVVVLSWRLTGILQASRRAEALRILNGGNSPSRTSAPADLEDCIRRQLATVGAQSGAHEVAHQVTTQLERTLHDFPCIRNSNEIKKYALLCSRLAWACLARTTPLVLDAAQGTEFKSEIHARHRLSPNPKGTRIKAVLWPGLREGCQGPYLHRAVVVTC
ncbi:hypothetical protein QAD02_022797, partial [Eretmocerus hayati]